MEKSKLREVDLQRFKLVIKTSMWHGTGIVRSEESLKGTMHKLEIVEKQIGSDPKCFEEYELLNMLTVAKLTTKAALDRKESRGAHYRSDFPQTDDRNWKRHLVYTIIKS